LAASYAAKLTAIKASKPKVELPTAPTDSPAEGTKTKPAVKTVFTKVNTDISKPLTKPQVSKAPTKPSQSPKVVKKPAVPSSPVVKKKTISAVKPLPVSADPPKKKFVPKPIKAPSPDRRVGVSSLDTLLLKAPPRATATQWKKWPNNSWKESSSYHPPAPPPVSLQNQSLDALIPGGGGNKYKWSAK